VTIVLTYIIIPVPTAGAGDVVKHTSGAPISGWSIVEEAWAHLADSLQGSVTSGLTLKVAQQNGLSKTHFSTYSLSTVVRPRLSQNQEQGGERIQVTVLEQLVQYKLLENGTSQREIRTVVERCGEPGPAVKAFSMEALSETGDRHCCCKG